MRNTPKLAERDTLLNWPLTSFPGSGITWTRQLIEGVTGIYTGSVYEGDPSPVKSKRSRIVTDDPRCGCTIMDKDHEATLNNGLWHYFQLLHREGLGGLIHQQYDRRGVLLLRNPMDVVFTFRNWAYSGKVGIAPPEAFTGPSWDETIDFVAYVWADHAIRWIEQIEKGTVIFYEKLLGSNADVEIERLLHAISFFPVDRERLKCTIKHRNRTDHKRLNNPRFFLEPQHQMKMMKSIHKVQESLRRRNWPRLPVYLFDFHNPDDRKP
ncbi:WSC domain-containing protein 1-like isoform X2 [Daphnia pulex]|uniref:WSC domain-containing protein 1-like isoform X2 n=1 Tax=Daphnia pulex TaxID=6669 RepID=UPI001EDED77F|nr:WSC domain-containing protein 1-like isoform X2 [Daphnia pulex]